MLDNKGYTHTHTHTLSLCNTYFFSKATVVALTRLRVPLCVHNLSCYCRALMLSSSLGVFFFILLLEFIFNHSLQPNISNIKFNLNVSFLFGSNFVGSRNGLWRRGRESNQNDSVVSPLLLSLHRRS